MNLHAAIQTSRMLMGIKVMFLNQVLQRIFGKYFGIASSVNFFCVHNEPQLDSSIFLPEKLI
jgi:uncharacterized protein (DUF2132 family)